MLKEDNSWLDYTKSQAYIREVLQYTSGGDTIDIGCWTGRNTFFLEENGFTVTAVDSDTEHINTLNKKIQEKGSTIEAYVSNILDIPGNKQYDLVLCTMVLHFLEPGDIQTGLKKLKDITKPGGVNLVSVLLKEGAFLPRPHLFQPGELRMYYSDWEELDYFEGLGPKYQKDEKSPIFRAPRAIIITRK